MSDYLYGGLLNVPTAVVSCYMQMFVVRALSNIHAVMTIDHSVGPYGARHRLKQYSLNVRPELLCRQAENLTASHVHHTNIRW